MTRPIRLSELEERIGNDFDGEVVLHDHELRRLCAALRETKEALEFYCQRQIRFSYSDHLGKTHHLDMTHAFRQTADEALTKIRQEVDFT